ncbi:MAG: peptidoglycan-binding protein [Actinobacteria bacterium]|nr:peptidoglycan-binding protein [Actinomycetota bacterium]
MTRPNMRPGLLAFAFMVLFSAATAAFGHPPSSGTLHDWGEQVDYDMVFPVQGDNTYSPGFWASRGEYVHHATDIMASKMTPVVAVADGVIYSVNWSTNPNDLRPHKCCNLIIDHDDGWQTKYYHLNNDTPGTDDGQGWGIAPGILPGTHVSAGQVIGWVGDSTNAENTSPHLHFELVDPEGTIVDAYLALKAAEGNRVASSACAPLSPSSATELLGGTRLLKVGARGTDVRQLQQALASGGYDPGGVDGVFGPKTAAAVKAFQAARGITADGIVGSESRRVLSNLLETSQYATALSPSGPILRPGDRGSAVREIQAVLEAAGFDPGPVDGVYGPKTVAAVKAYQQQAGIGVDGKVGPVTRRSLASSLGVTGSGC